MNLRFLLAPFATLMIAGLLMADWPMARGVPERTGTRDPDTTIIPIHTPKILWAYKSQEHFIASPVPDKNLLFISGLGAFNTAQFHAVATEDSPANGQMPATKRGIPVWSKASPFIKLPTVSSPAVYDDLVIFGDGMHQTDGAVLYAIDRASGRSLWRFEVPGKLVHMEGAPLVDANYPGGPAVFIGGGDAGILAVRTHQVTVENHPMDLPRLRTFLEKKWLQLQKKYDIEKLKDPELAIPPTDDALPLAVPKKLWQKGEKTWHVDSSLALAGEKILATSAYIDEEKIGKRVVLALDKVTGNTLWEVNVDINPWAGVTVAGKVAIVGCSSIRFDRNLIDQGRGQLLALDIESGNLLWKQDISGGVLSSVAVKDNLAVIATTNGRVRAYDIATGQQKWRYAHKSGFFAGPAIAGTGDSGVVYACDVDGTLLSLRLSDGELLWAMDVPHAPQVNAAGMVFGSPVVHKGAVYLATCNVSGPNANQPCAAVCIVDETFKIDSERPKLALEKYVDGHGLAKGGKITIPAQIAPRKLATLKDVYPLEILACYPAPQGQKAHETVVVSEVLPSDIHKALIALGAKPGTPIKGEGVPTGTELKLSFLFTGPSGKARVIPIEKTIVDKRTGKTMPPIKWFFTGSILRKLDPEKPEASYAADITGTYATLYPVTDETVIQSDIADEVQSFLKLEINPNLVPEELTDVSLVIEVPG